MKNRILTILCMALAAMIIVPASQAQQVDDRKLYEEAVTAYKARDYATAYEGFSELQKNYPTDAKIRYYFNNARMNLRASKPVRANLEAELQAIVLPEIELDGASLDVVFSFISAKADELSGGKVAANFIYKGTAEERDEPNISLRLKNVPLTEVIRYVGEISGTQFKYETHAIVGMPRRMLAVPASSDLPEPPRKNPFLESNKPKDPFA